MQYYMFRVLIIIIGLSVSNHSFGVIRIILSAALVDAHYEFRKQQYIECLDIFNLFGFHDVYIVEAVKKKGPTFLDDYSKNVYYAQNNNPTLPADVNGVNEAKTLLEALYHFDFDDDDMIIKMTGRYQLISDYFLKTVANNPDIDAFVKLFSYNGFYPNVYTSCFAMKCKYFKEMLETYDYDAMRNRITFLEYATGLYIRRKADEGDFKVMYLKKLDMSRNIFGSTTALGAPNQVIIH